MASVILNIGPVIAKDASLSNAVDCTVGTIVRIFVPPEWTPAPLSFVLSPDNVLPYATVCNADGRERILRVEPNSMILGTIIAGGWIKFRSGNATLAMPQKNACTFRVGFLDQFIA